MLDSHAQLRARLVAAGLERHADALVALALPSVRLLLTEQAAGDAVAFRHTPVQIAELRGVRAIAGGMLHSLALLADGSVVAWGSNDRGQLGDGTRQERRAPVRVGDLDGVIAIALGTSHSVALLADGSVLAWGHNRSGQLGDGTRSDRRKPVPVEGLDRGVIAIAAGGETSLALLSDGSVVGWGLNAREMRGIDDSPDRPVPIDGLSSGVSTIATGGSARLGLMSDGSLRAWGPNHYGELGDGTTTDRFPPVSLSAISQPITAIAAGDSHCLALTSQGSVLAWGSNGWGELGDGTTTHRRMPVQVAEMVDRQARSPLVG